PGTPASSTPAPATPTPDTPNTPDIAVDPPGGNGEDIVVIPVTPAPDTTPKPPVAPATPVPGDTLSFLFFPGKQDAIDDHTGGMLDIFLSAAGDNLYIVAETSLTSDEDEAALISALTGALAERGVPVWRLEHVSRNYYAADGGVEIKLYYIPRALK
ncbi:MAG: hypothetical protein FWH06_06180, partial [Oscillospiraceae bacterium]|nr:hypothetical protein [Oscillospiraceae bacterium]